MQHSVDRLTPTGREPDHGEGGWDVKVRKPRFRGRRTVLSGVGVLAGTLALATGLALSAWQLSPFTSVVPRSNPYCTLPRTARYGSLYSMSVSGGFALGSV